MRRALVPPLALLTLVFTSTAQADACELVVLGGGLFVSSEVYDETGNAITALTATLTTTSTNLELNSIGKNELDKASLILSADEIQIRFELIRSLSCRQSLIFDLPKSFMIKKKNVLQQFQKPVPKDFKKLLPEYVIAQLEFSQRSSRELNELSDPERQTLVKAAFNLLRFAENLPIYSSGALAADREDTKRARGTLDELLGNGSSCYPKQICQDYQKLALTDRPFNLALAGIRDATEPTEARKAKPDEVLPVLINVRERIASMVTLPPTSQSPNRNPCFWTSRISIYQAKIVSVRDVLTSADRQEIEKTIGASRVCSLRAGDQADQDAKFLQTLLDERQVY